VLLTPFVLPYDIPCYELLIEFLQKIFFYTVDSDDISFHILQAPAGSANLVMTHRDKAKYSYKHLPQQAKEVNTVTCLYIARQACCFDKMLLYQLEVCNGYTSHLCTQMYTAIATFQIWERKWMSIYLPRACTSLLRNSLSIIHLSGMFV